MKRYLIEEANCGVTRGGMACGPVGGSVVVTVKYREGGSSRWLSAVECDGIPNYFLTDRDVFGDLMEENFADQAFWDYLMEHNICEFNGLALGEYWDLFSGISEDPDNPAAPLLRYAVALLRCDMDEVEGLTAMAGGRYADEIDIPVSDAEEEYLEEQEEE